MGVLGQLVSTCTLGAIPAGPTTSGMGSYKGNKICVQGDPGMTSADYDSGFVSKYEIHGIAERTCSSRGMGENIPNGVASSMGLSIWQQGA